MARTIGFMVPVRSRLLLSNSPLWSEVNALKEEISMPARTPWQKTMGFVDGLQERLPDAELVVIKRYVERRSREEAQAQITVTPVDTVQHCMYVCMYVWSSHIAEYGSTV